MDTKVKLYYNTNFCCIVYSSLLYSINMFKVALWPSLIINQKF
jgi:hypothetical protein